MQSEANLQAKCYRWAYNSYPQLRGLLFSVPNGGTRNIREAMALKATGLTPGIPDLILLYNGITGFEFKTSSGRLSPAQIKIHTIWRKNNIEVYLIRDEETFKEIIEKLVCKHY